MKPRRAYSGGTPGGSTTSAGLFLRAAATGGASGRQCNPRWLGRTANSASSGRATSGFASTIARHRAHPHSTHLTMANRANRWLLQRLFSEILGGPILKRLPWSATCLSPMRQGELLATQNPDGSLVFSAVLKDEQGLLSFLLVPPSPSSQRTPPEAVGPQKVPGSEGSRRPVGRRLAF